MERVAFLVESTGERISCRLNPESVVVRRQAGLRPRTSAGGQLTGAALSDDPLLANGGGTTELDLDLLFDVSLAAAPVPLDDVRQLTRPLWDLAENRAPEGDFVGPPRVRFVWGKAWNVPAMVSDVAERLEQFTPAGAPQRSWMRLRLVRVAEAPPTPLPPMVVPVAGTVDVSGPDAPAYQVVGGGPGDAPANAERLDVVVARLCGDPDLTKVIARANGIPDLLHVAAGTVIRVPRFLTARAPR